MIIDCRIILHSERGDNMRNVYESIMAGLNEAIEDAQDQEKKLPRRKVTIVPAEEYQAEEVKKLG